ncbi:hypothetical protein ACFOG5_24465 [Pedobacter fastidiosus]|uniref:hypothetical protein n=1 Tax=Pedobacter fastidiosus TaxID=2765361 RepID=UPI00361DF34F
MYYLDDNGNRSITGLQKAVTFLLISEFSYQKPPFLLGGHAEIEVITIVDQAVQEIYLASNTWNNFGRLMAEQVYYNLMKG